MIHVQIRKSDQFGAMGQSFMQLTGMRLSAYLLDYGIIPDSSLYRHDDGYNHYYMLQIESKFMPFIAANRSSFLFSAEGQPACGWIKGLTDAELDTIVPETFPYTFGRTFRQYFGQLMTIDGITYGTMHTYYQGDGYTSRDTYPDQSEFWLFYDYFGCDRVVISQDMPTVLDLTF